MNSTKTAALAGVTLATALVLSACSGTSDAEASNDQATTAVTNRDTNPLYGAWDMTSLEQTVDGAMQEVPYSGQIIFTESGRMSTQAMVLVPNTPDTDYTVQGYESYYGALQVDPEQGTFTVDVDSSAAPALREQELTRNYEITDDTLVITPADASEGWRVTYERFDS